MGRCVLWTEKYSTWRTLTFMGPYIVISSNITNKMQRYTIFFITLNAVHVSGGFSVHQQELKNCTHSIRYMSSLLAATTSSSKQAWHIPDAVCTVFELLMMGGETAWNMYSIESNKEYCITLHLVGYIWRWHLKNICPSSSLSTVTQK